jgi:hypothetical protein
MSYIPLANVTLGASAATVTFSSIPATYRDLVLVVDGSGTDALTYAHFRVNNNSTDYSYVFANGNGVTANSQGPTDDKIQVPGRDSYWTNTYRTQVVVNLMDYAQTDRHKHFLVRSGAASSATEMQAGRWANTAAITSIRFTMNVGSFAIGSTFALYGIIA